jgi:hypothetical protein
MGNQCGCGGAPEEGEVDLKVQLHIVLTIVDIEGVKSQLSS